MNNFLKPINPSVVDYLIQAQEEFTLLPVDSQEAIVASEWLENNFPIASWGRIAWNEVTESYCATWNNNSDLITTFEKIILENQLKGDVTVLWTNALKLIKLFISGNIRRHPAKSCIEVTSAINLCPSSVRRCNLSIIVFRRFNLCANSIELSFSATRLLKNIWKVLST